MPISPEHMLGSEYRVDHMLLGRNAIGDLIILVRFEDVNVRLTIVPQINSAYSEKCR